MFKLFKRRAWQRGRQQRANPFNLDGLHQSWTLTASRPRHHVTSWSSSLVNVASLEPYVFFHFPFPFEFLSAQPYRLTAPHSENNHNLDLQLIVRWCYQLGRI
jgi:hypothetical protein